MLAHAYYDFFVQKKAAEEAMKKMAKAMGVSDPETGKDFIKALDQLLVSVGCDKLSMRQEGIKENELKLFPPKIHQVIGGDITADPMPLSDEDYYEIYQAAWKQ